MGQVEACGAKSSVYTALYNVQASVNNLLQHPLHRVRASLCGLHSVLSKFRSKGYTLEAWTNLMLCIDYDRVHASQTLLPL